MENIIIFFVTFGTLLTLCKKGWFQLGSGGPPKRAFGKGSSGLGGQTAFVQISSKGT